MGRLQRSKLEEGGSIFLQNVDTFNILHRITSLRVITVITFLTLVKQLLLYPKRNAVKIFALGCVNQE